MQDLFSNILKDLIFEKDDRCLRIAKRKYSKPSAYRSGAQVRCEKGQIWKDLKEGENPLKDIKYTLRRPGKNVVIFVSTDALLKQHTKDQPSYDVTNKSNQIGGRVQKAKDFITNYALDNRWIHPKTGERSNSMKATFEPSVVALTSDGKISFEDGRHRVVAAKEMGIKEVPIEVPKDQVEAIKKLLSSGVNESVSSSEKVVCANCGWSWDTKDSDDSDKYICHKCGYDNTPEIEEADFSKEKEQGLHGWFSRQGGKGKSKGWVDCNTCKNDPKTGKKKCKSCGRQAGEKRSKYPSCRPTPAQCDSPGKGDKWGKTK